MEEIINKIKNKEDLSPEEAKHAMTEIMSGRVDQPAIVEFLTALRDKGETVDEIVAFAKVMREFALKINPKVEGSLVDTCGTGGDELKTFNVSTAAAFVVAGAGVPVAKHGNRSFTSKCGSADVLEALGVKINLKPEEIDGCIEKANIGFMFAPLHHSAMKHVIGARKEIGTRTVFNILGPLASPAEVKSQVVGVYDPDVVEKIARVLVGLGVERGFVVHGSGLDEISNISETDVCEIVCDEVKKYKIKPEDFGITRANLEDLQGGMPDENAEIIRKILDGERGPRRDIVVMNAAAALVAGWKAKDLDEGIKLAEESIDSGKALEALEKLIEVSNSVSNS